MVGLTGRYLQLNQELRTFPTRKCHMMLQCVAVCYSVLNFFSVWNEKSIKRFLENIFPERCPLECLYIYIFKYNIYVYIYIYMYI